MKVIVLIPGIMGSRLSLEGDEVWPPSVLEAKLGYKRNLIWPMCVGRHMRIARWRSPLMGLNICHMI